MFGWLVGVSVVVLDVAVTTAMQLFYKMSFSLLFMLSFRFTLVILLCGMRGFVVTADLYYSSVIQVNIMLLSRWWCHQRLVKFWLICVSIGPYMSRPKLRYI
ncbi:hypothetical protein GQX74_007445 [Glossina fuscipes]|nr:hypothetical protein GQX74_007445 [Glossina fuscipes]